MRARVAVSASCLTLLCASLVVATSQAQSAEKKEDEKSPPTRLTPATYLDWENVASPKISPDGRQVVFTRMWVDKVNDKMQSELWLMNADGSRPRQLCEGSEPEWSPDGQRVAFVREGKPKGAQVHVMWIDTHEVTQITRVDESPTGLRWTRDGKRLAFQMVVPEKGDAVSIELPARPKEAKWAEDPKVISRLHYRSDQSGYRPAGWHHLFVVDADGGTPRQVTSGDFDHGVGEWTPDGRRLVFDGNRSEDADWQVRESEIYSVDVESGAVTQLTRHPGPDTTPIVSPDGRYIAYKSDEFSHDTYGVPKLWLMDVDGGHPRALTAGLDREPGDLLWSADSRNVYFTADSEGRRQAHRVDLDGRIEPLSRGDVRFTASSVGKDGAVFGVATGPQRPRDVAVVRSVSGQPADVSYLTAVNDDVIGRLKLARVEEIRYPSKDGLEIQGWLVKPSDFDPNKKYPLILEIHGGPHGMYGFEFSFDRQWNAAEGFVVLYTNPRGSSGYGKSFGNSILHAYPGKDYDDLMAGVDKAISMGFVDEKNLFVYGGSGGGVLTCWIVGHTDRFRAAVSMFPVTDWVSFVGTTDGPWWYDNFEKLPWEDVTEHWNRSPLKYVGNVKTPTLLITGELDLRTPMGQTEEYYQALKLRKVETAMVRIQDEYHGAAGRHPSNALRRTLYVQQWFKKHMEKGDAAASPKAASAGG